MSQEIIEGIRTIEREKGIEAGTLVAALEDALLAAYKKTPGAARHATVELDDDGEFRVYALDSLAYRFARLGGEVGFRPLGRCVEDGRDALVATEASLPSRPQPVRIEEAIDQVREIAEAYRSNDRTRRLLDDAQKLQGLARHASVRDRSGTR